MLWGVFNVASVPRGTRAAEAGQGQWTALPGAWEGVPPPFCLQPAYASTSAFRQNAHRSSKLLTLTQPFTKTLFMEKLATLGRVPVTSVFGPTQLPCSSLQPLAKGAQGQGDSNLKVLVKEMMVWQKNGWSPGEPRKLTPLSSPPSPDPFPLQSRPTGSRACQSASGSIPPDWMN